MSNVASKQLLIGLPHAGKTTFIAALWHVVQSLRHQSALRLDGLDGNIKYLNQITEAWLECRPMTRTMVENETVVSMRLREEETGRVTTLYFTDLSGESFELQWTERQWTSAYEALLREATGALLFVNPDKVITPERIDQAEAMISELHALLGIEESREAGSGKSTPWAPANAPTQVQLVELLQFIRGTDFFRPPFRLAVMISAWDRVLTAKRSPEEWLHWQLPLLGQFLQTNVADFETVFYGVSAQGGAYDAPHSSALAHKEPVERILIVGSKVLRRHDLSEPLRWLMR